MAVTLTLTLALALTPTPNQVLHTDATVVLVRDVRPFLSAQPQADMLVQREGGPPPAV